MRPPQGKPGRVNVHAAWRMAVAGRAAQAYAGNGRLAALTVAGSVGAGLADRFSDLELDCYWSSAPGDADRTGPIDALGGELTGFSEYEQDDQEWGEEYLVGDLGVTVSNFTTGTVERWLDDVLLNAGTAPVKHMRLAALQRSRPLLGAELIASWRDWPIPSPSGSPRLWCGRPWSRRCCPATLRVAAGRVNAGSG